MQGQAVPGGGPEPGELLYTVGPDWRRIGLEALIRLAVSAFAAGGEIIMNLKARELQWS